MAEQHDDPPDDGISAPTRWSDLATPAIAYTAVAVVLTALQYAAQKGGRGLDDVWIRYDAGAYVTIARNGYSWAPSDRYPLIAWFPGYPLAIRALAAVIGNAVLAAVLISYASGLTAACLLWRWMARQVVIGHDRLIALGVVLLFAWGWYLYGVAYGDALFLALALGAFLLAEQGRLPLATVLAAVATAERPTGVVLTLGLLVLAMERDGAVCWNGWRRPSGGVRFPLGTDRSRMRPGHLVPLLSLVGVAGYSGFLAARFGRPLLWLEAQDKWRQGPSAGPASWFKVHMAARIVEVHEPAYLAKSLTQLAAVVLVAATVPAIGRRFGLAYAVYVGSLVGIVALGSNDFVGPGRYLLAAFPTAALLGEWLGRRRTATAVWFGISAGALVVQTILFARGAYLS